MASRWAQRHTLYHIDYHFNFFCSPEVFLNLLTHSISYKWKLYISPKQHTAVNILYFILSFKFVGNKNVKSIFLLYYLLCFISQLESTECYAFSTSCFLTGSTRLGLIFCTSKMFFLSNRWWNFKNRFIIVQEAVALQKLFPHSKEK